MQKQPIKISGFTVIKNAGLMAYPVVESIKSLLPLVDEFVVGVGLSDDNTLEIIRSIADPKLKIFETIWDKSKTKGGLLLSEKTNEALAQCSHDWCFYIQADEVVHEADLMSVKGAIERASQLPECEGLLFDYIHFYGSFSVIATNRKWYRKEIRVVRKSSGAKSYGDAQGFRVPLPVASSSNESVQAEPTQFRKLNVIGAKARIFHYGWVKPPQKMGAKKKLLDRLWHGNARDAAYDHFDFDRQFGLKSYQGQHPAIMRDQIAAQDWTFDFKKRLKDWNLKELNLLLSFLVEKLVGYRIGENKPYRLIK